MTKLKMTIYDLCQKYTYVHNGEFFNINDAHNIFIPVSSMHETSL